MKKSDQIIRVGDRVEVVIPKLVKRVGYPKAVEDYLPEVDLKFGPVLRKELGGLNPYSLNKIRKELAYGLARRDGFGGRTRSIFLEDEPQLLGHVTAVAAVRTVLTGEYMPSSSSRSSYYGEENYEPAYIDARVAHRLIQLQSVPYFQPWRMAGRYGFEVPSYHLKKLSPDSL